MSLTDEQSQFYRQTLEMTKKGTRSSTSRSRRSSPR